MDKGKKLEESIYESDQVSPGLLFWRAFHNWQRLIRNELEKCGITQVQYAILAALSYLTSDGRKVTQQDIASLLSMDKMMVSQVLDNLIRKDLVKKKKHPTDGRAYSLAVTKAGMEVVHKSTPLVEAVDETFFRSVGPDYVSFLTNLRQLATSR